MKDPLHTFKLRMSPDLLDRVSEQAQRNRRSRTQEILTAVEEHLVRAGQERSRPASAGGAQTVGNTLQG